MADDTFDPVLRMKEVIKITTLSRTTIYRGIKNKTFPQPKRLGPNSIGWPKSVITSWLHDSGEPSTPASDPTSAASS